MTTITAHAYLVLFAGAFFYLTLIEAGDRHIVRVGRSFLTTCTSFSYFCVGSEIIITSRLFSRKTWVCNECISVTRDLFLLNCTGICISYCYSCRYHTHPCCVERRENHYGERLGSKCCSGVFFYWFCLECYTDVSGRTSAVIVSRLR
jgi:hypothetical protein